CRLDGEGSTDLCWDTAMGLRTATPALALLIVVAIGPGTGRAENRDQAKEAYRLGVQHYDLGEYAAALAAFKDAYRNYESPSLLYNIGQCHRRLHEKAEALRAYRMYLNEVPNAPDRRSVESQIRELEAEIAADEALRARSSQAASPRRTPLHKRWWLWATVA